MAGHQLHLAGSLMQQQVEATRDGDACFRHGERERCRPWVVDHIEQRGWTAAGNHRPFCENVGGAGRDGGDQQIPVAHPGGEGPQVHRDAQPARGSQQANGPSLVTHEHHYLVQA
jgi:hypothetical protein